MQVKFKHKKLVRQFTLSQNMPQTATCRIFFCDGITSYPHSYIFSTQPRSFYVRKKSSRNSYQWDLKSSSVHVWQAGLVNFVVSRGYNLGNQFTLKYTDVISSCRWIQCSKFDIPWAYGYLIFTRKRDEAEIKIPRIFVV